MAVTGQLWFETEGNGSDVRVERVNSDGSNETVVTSTAANLKTSFPQRIGLDTAAGYYFAIVNGGDLGGGAYLVRGSISGGAATVVADYTVGTDQGDSNGDDNLVNALVVDDVNHYIYVGEQEPTGSNPGQSGIRRYSYDPITGAVSGGAFIVTAQSAGRPTDSIGAVTLDPRDFALDRAGNTLFYTERLDGADQGVYRMDLTTHTIVQMSNSSQFPDDGSQGNIGSVEVDAVNHLVYFTTFSQSPSGTGTYVPAQNKIWVLAEGATNATATAVTINGLPGGNHFYPGDFVFDAQSRQLYVTSEETGTSEADDVIYVLQLDAAGTTATYVRSISPSPAFSSTANIDGLAFDDLPVLSLAATSTHAVEQGSAVTLLASAPTITDVDGGYLSSATVQITAGTFSSNETSANDDHLSVLASALSGTSITASYNSSTETLTLTGYDTIAHYQQVLAGVQYSTTGDNPTDFDLNTTRTVTFTVSDGAQSIPAGQQNSGTTTLTIDAVNDAPVNTVPGAQTFDEDTSKVFSTGNGNALSVADVDIYPTTPLTVTLSVAHGTLTLSSLLGLTFSTGDGTSDTTMTFSGNANAINAALHNGLTYAPNADYYGSDALTFATNDNGHTGSGGAQTTTSTIALTINPVADIANDSATTNEDTAVNISVQANDSFENSGHQITSVTQGAHGAVAIDTHGTGDTSDDTILYTANANYNGSDSFTYTVTSGGATETATVNVTVNAVNDAPAGSDGSVTTLEDTAYVFTASDFGFSDSNDSPANALAAVRITTLPAGGTLRDNGITVSAGQYISIADINANQLVFTPAADANGTGYASLTFQVQDNGGTASGGVDTDQSPNTLTINVTPVNDAPSGTNETVTINEDTPYTLAASDFGFSDSDGNSLAAVVIDALPGAGTLTDNGVAVTEGQPASVADINAGYLVFTPDANANGTGYASFTFQVQDDGGTAHNGVDTDPTAHRVVFNVNPVNDAPSGADNTVTTNEDTPYTLAASDFGFSDTDGNSLAAVVIATLPGAGTLTDNGVTVIAGQHVGIADINAGDLIFTPYANANGTGYASFTFQVQDDGGTAHNGVDTDQTPNTLTFNVPSVNDAPSGANETLTINEDTPYTLAASDFGFSDSDGNSLAAVVIDTLPGAGTLADNGVAVTAGQPVSMADINAGYLVFTPAADENGAGYASFTFQVQDDGGTANGGVDTDPTAHRVVFDVNAVNDAPTLTATALDPGYIEGDAPVQVFSGASASTVESGQGFTGLTLTVDNVSAGDRLTLDGVFVGLNDGASFNGQTDDGTISVSLAGGVATVTLALSSAIDSSDLNDLIDAIAFTSVSSNPGDASRTVTITSLSDDGGTTHGGSDTAALSLSSTVSVTPVDDAPVAVADSFGVLADTPKTLDLTANDTDVDDGPKMIARIDGTAVSAGDSVTLDSGAIVTLNGDGTVTYDANGAFDYLVSAQTAAATGATDSSASDSFSYTLNGGSDTTVSVNVQGADGPGDEIRGSAGNDKLTGTTGDDTIIGEGGYDTVFYTNATSGVTVSLSNTAPQDTGGAGTDTLVDILGLTGSNYADTLAGDSHNNYLRGGGGNDNLDGGANNDVLDGGGGFDRAIYSDATSGVTIDLNLTGPQAAGGSGSDTLTNIEAVTGSNYNDTLTGDSHNNELKGAAGDDLLVGGGGNDQLNGGSGFDTASFADAGMGVHVDLSNAASQNTGVGFDTLTSIEGINGSIYNDILTGSDAANMIRGGAGADRIDGGLGSDTLVGGTGADKFFFTATLGSTNIDTIADFTVGEDRVYLYHNVFTGLASGTLKSSEFVTGTAATGSGAQIIYDSTSGALLYDRDGTGSAAAVQFATLSTGLNLTAASFSVFNSVLSNGGV